MRLGLRLFLIYFAIACLFFLTAISVITSQGLVIEETRQILDEDGKMLKLLWDLNLRFDEAWRRSRLAAMQPELGEQAAASRLEVDRLVMSSAEFELADERPVGDEMRAIWGGLRPTLERLEKSGARASLVFAEDVSPAIDEFTIRFRALENMRRRTSENRAQHIQRITAASLRQFQISIALLFVSGIALVIFVRYSLLLPVKALRAATEAIASGNFSAIEHHANDEIGDLARRFNSMSERLAEAEKAKMEFLSMVSHDMRTPLTAISGYAGLIMTGRRGEVTPKQMEGLKIISSEAERLAFLVEDLLDAARARAGTFRIEPKMVNLGEVLPGTIKAFERTAESRKISLTVDLGGLPKATADAARLGQALRNLVGNALKFTPEGGSVTVSGRAENNEIIIEVKDTGRGIPEVNLPHLFDRFYQVSEKKDSERGGVGLGLAIVKDIAEGHGGRVEVQSVVDRGTTFTIRLPL